MTLEHKILGQLNVDSLVETFDFEKFGFVAIASSSTAAYSTDGITWTQTTMPADADWRSVTYGEDKFLAVGASYSSSVPASYSTDGISWTQSSIPNFSESRYGLYSVSYGGGAFSAVGYNIANFQGSEGAYSTDGITWSLTTMFANSSWRSVTYGEDKFFAVGYYSGSTTTAAYSTNGITWTQTTMPASVGWQSVTYGDGIFLAVAYGTTTAAYSTDAITWTQTTMPASVQWRSVTYGDGTFAAIASSTTTAAYSTDGITWTQTTMPASVGWRSVTYGDGTFAAVAGSYFGDNTTAAYSTDGITWTQTTLPASAFWRSVTYGEKNIIISTYDPKTIYTVPSNTETIVTSIFVSNTSASSDNYDFAVVPNGETLSDIHYIRKSVELPANDFHNIETKLTLSAGDQIVAQSLFNNIQVNVFGVEKS